MTELKKLEKQIQEAKAKAKHCYTEFQSNGLVIHLQKWNEFNQKKLELIKKWQRASRYFEPNALSGRKNVNKTIKTKDFTTKKDHSRYFEPYAFSSKTKEGIVK